jgi:integrase/recombinase XerD
MPSPTDSVAIEWFRYPLVAADALARARLSTETLLGLAPNTMDAYARGLDDFLGFCQKAEISPMMATRADLACYVGDLRGRPRPQTNLGTPDLAPSTGECQAGCERVLVPRFQTLPWIPSDEQWRAFLAVVKQASLRTRCMAALAYNEHQR